jgi:hypothetical protein
MPSANSSPGRDRDRVSALAAGLAATIAVLIFAGAFAPNELESISRYSPWVYGPAATAVWALFSAVAYQIIIRDQGRKTRPNSLEGYRCRELKMAAEPTGCPVCANQEEKDRLGGVTAGFALTISTWVAALSFMPDDWLGWLGEAPAGIYCVASVTLWVAFSEAMYLIFRALREKSV